MDVTEGEAKANPLDKEITSLKKQASKLRKTLKIECSTILSSPSIRDALLSSLNQPKPPPTPRSAALRPRRPRRSSDRDRDEQQRLLSRSKQQEAYDQQCLYRIAASVTAFKVRDPDPNAVDGGHVLGLRFEAMTRGQFLQPYYVMLNRPYADSRQFLRVHRHTVPPAIPLAGLAARYLPRPMKQQQQQQQAEADDSSRHHVKQDLERFVKSLRREIMRYHNRLGVSADLRRSLGAHSSSNNNMAPSSPNNAIVDVSIADTEAKQIRLTWADERNGRLVMDDDGRVVKFVVFGASDGRDWETTRQLGDSQGRVEDVAKMLQEYAWGAL
ncbi:Cenp-O kinetochore centromere component domain-containing protein [Trichoderma austrokoningii]